MLVGFLARDLLSWRSADMRLSFYLRQLIAPCSVEVEVFAPDWKLPAKGWLRGSLLR